MRAGESLFWEVYESTVLQLITSDLEQIDIGLQRAIWLQTPAGREWLWEVEQTDGAEGRNGVLPAIPFDSGESVQYVYASYLLRRAEEDPSGSVDDYIERDQSARADLDRDPGRADQ